MNSGNHVVVTYTLYSHVGSQTVNVVTLMARPLLIGP